MTVQYGLMLNEFADRSTVNSSIGAKFDLLAIKAESQAASLAAAECGGGSVKALLFYDLLDRAVSRLLPGENAKIRLDYLSCLVEKLHWVRRCGGDAAVLFFDWERAASDGEYYRHVLQLLHGCSAVLADEKLKAVLPMRFPAREVDAGFFRKLLIDCAGIQFELGLDFHIHDPAAEKIEWEKELEGLLFSLRTVFLSYEPLLGNMPNMALTAKVLQHLDRFDLCTRLFFAPKNLTAPVQFEEEIERLKIAVDELRGRLKSC